MDRPAVQAQRDQADAHYAAVIRARQRLDRPVSWFAMLLPLLWVILMALVCCL